MKVTSYEITEIIFTNEEAEKLKQIAMIFREKNHESNIKTKYATTIINGIRESIFNDEEYVLKLYPKKPFLSMLKEISEFSCPPLFAKSFYEYIKEVLK